MFHKNKRQIPFIRLPLKHEQIDIVEEKLRKGKLVKKDDYI